MRRISHRPTVIDGRDVNSQVRSVNLAGTPATYKVQLAVTDEIKIDTAGNTYLPVRAGVVQNVKGGNG